MKAISKVFQILIVLLMFALFARGMIVIFGIKTPVDDKKPHIAIVQMKGVIENSDGIIKIFEELEKKDSVKGYILRIDSPGGGVVPSQQIYEYLLTIKKPLYVAMESTAASGGYMTALAANKIYAMPSTVTGSIGVIMQYNTFSGLFEKIGLSTTTIKSGELKDVGNISREPTQADVRMLTAVIDDMYTQFIQAVSTRRNMPLDEVKKIADGSIYTGQMAKKLNLIDGLGSWQDVFQEMKKDLNMENVNYINILPSKKGNLEKLLTEKLDIRQNPLSPGFYYIFMH